MYANFNSYTPRKYLINYIRERHDVNCTLFVETKTNEYSNTKHRNWNIVQTNGNIVNINTRGGSLIQCHPGLNKKKQNPPRMNNPRNEALHVSVPFLGDNLHIFLVYIHPDSLIEQSFFNKVSMYMYAIIINRRSQCESEKSQANQRIPE